MIIFARVMVFVGIAYIGFFLGMRYESRYLHLRSWKPNECITGQIFLIDGQAWSCNASTSWSKR